MTDNYFCVVLQHVIAMADLHVYNKFGCPKGTCNLRWMNIQTKVSSVMKWLIFLGNVLSFSRLLRCNIIYQYIWAIYHTVLVHIILSIGSRSDFDLQSLDMKHYVFNNDISQQRFWSMLPLNSIGSSIILTFNIHNAGRIKTKRQFDLLTIFDKNFNLTKVRPLFSLSVWL